MYRHFTETYDGWAAQFSVEGLRSRGEQALAEERRSREVESATLYITSGVY